MTIGLPGWLTTALGWIGEHFPEGDEDACRRQADRWRDLATGLDTYRQQLADAGQLTLAAYPSGDFHDQLDPKFTSLSDDMKTLADNARKMAERVDDVATQIEFAKEMIIANLALLAVTIISLFWSPFGAAVIAARAAMTKAAVRIGLAKALEKIGATAATKVLTRVSVESLEKLTAALSANLKVVADKVAQNAAKKAVENAGRKALERGALKAKAAQSTVKKGAEKVLGERGAQIAGRAGVKSLQGSLVFGGISGGLDAGVQGFQIATGGRSSFDIGSTLTSTASGALTGAVAGPLLRNPVGPGLNLSQRFGAGISSAVGNTAGIAAAEAAFSEGHHVNFGEAAAAGALFGAIDGARTDTTHSGTLSGDHGSAGLRLEAVHPETARAEPATHPDAPPATNHTQSPTHPSEVRAEPPSHTAPAPTPSARLEAPGTAAADAAARPAGSETARPQPESRTPQQTAPPERPAKSGVVEPKTTAGPTAERGTPIAGPTDRPATTTGTDGVRSEQIPTRHGDRDLHRDDPLAHPADPVGVNAGEAGPEHPDATPQQGPDDTPGPQPHNEDGDDAAAAHAGESPDAGAGWQGTDGLHLDPDQNAAADAFLAQARDAEPGITESMQQVAAGLDGGKLTGLEHRLKGEERFKEKLAEQIVDAPRETLADHFALMKDSIRYTMLSEDRVYADNVNRAVTDLVSRGYECVKFKNFWGDSGGYQGINSFWRDPATGHVFEVQFHTPSSFDAKMTTHPLYEEQRLPGTSSERLGELQRLQAEEFDAVPRPAGSSALEAPPIEAGPPPPADHAVTVPDDTGGGAPHPEGFVGPYPLPPAELVTPPRDGAFFWSGRDAAGDGVGPDSAGGSGAADRYAAQRAGTTLEGLLERNGVEPPKFSFDDAASQDWWSRVSGMYAENVRGEVNAVIGSNLRPGNVWETVELPRLKDNPNVTRIVTIDPDTGIRTTVFERDGASSTPPHHPTPDTEPNQTSPTPGEHPGRVEDPGGQPPAAHPTGAKDTEVRPSPGDHRVERIRGLIDEYRDALDAPKEPADPAAAHPAPDDIAQPHPRDADDLGAHEPLFDGSDLSADERQALRDLWDGLSPDERRYLYALEPMFGEHAALPVEVCDHYARQAAQDLHDQLKADVDMRVKIGGPPPTAGEWDRLRMLNNLLKSVEHPQEDSPRFLLGFEHDGRSITSVGNPDTASHTVVFAPGTFTSHERLNEFQGRHGSRPGYMEISERIQYQLRRELRHDKVAVVDYQNYHAPQSLYNPLTGAANPRFAQDGAAQLRNHCDRLQDSNQTGDNHVWVLGHSYGTVLVGEAARGYHGLNADGIINLGSPGLRVDDVSGLKLKGQHLMPGDAPVHTMTRSDDPILYVDEARQWYLDFFGAGHGLMPHHPEFGGHIWDVDGPKHRDPHNAYFDEGNIALHYIAEVVAGAEPSPAPAPRGPVWFPRPLPPPIVTGDTPGGDDPRRTQHDRLVADYEQLLSEQPGRLQPDDGGPPPGDRGGP